MRNTPDALLTCPRCGSPNFSLRGLRAHRCTGGNRSTGKGDRLEKRRLTATELALARDLTDPPMPYEAWRALGPEKAAEYLARRRGYTARQQGKLWAILEYAWDKYG